MTGKQERRPRLETRMGHYCARCWGDVQRRIAIGGKVYPDGGIVVDGWPSTSPSAQWKEGDGGSHRTRRQHFDEVHTWESLVVTRAMVDMTELERLILRLVYVEGRGAPKMVWAVNKIIGRNRLYELLHGALARIEHLANQEGGRDK